MVEKRDEASPPMPEGTQRRRATPEETWIKSFLEFSGTDNVTRFYRAELRGVSLTQAVDAICRGEMVNSEKCEGPGAVCTFRHDSDDGVVEVVVFFSAAELVLEIRGADIVMEVESEPDDAA